MPPGVPKHGIGGRCLTMSLEPRHSEARPPFPPSCSGRYLCPIEVAAPPWFIVAALRFSDSLAFGPEDFPLRSMRVELELGLASDGAPLRAHHRLVVEALRRLLDEASKGRVLTHPVRRAKTSRPQRGKLHKKSARSVHRFLLAVEALTRDGPAPMLGEVGRHAGLSGPPMAKIVNPHTRAGAYAAPLINVHKEGHAKRITLTAQGRRVAEHVASGELDP